MEFVIWGFHARFYREECVKLARFSWAPMRCNALTVGLLVATAAALRPPPARRGISRRAAIFSAGSAATSCLLSHPAFAGAAPAAARPHTACASRSCVATDAGAEREIAALTKKIAADEEDLIEDRKVISPHTRSTVQRAAVQGVADAPPSPARCMHPRLLCASATPCTAAAL